MTARALRRTARRIRQLAAEAALLRAELERLVAAIAPWLLELSGWGRSAPPSAGELVSRLKRASPASRSSCWNATIPPRCSRPRCC
jgi:hypothetical protein